MKRFTKRQQQQIKYGIRDKTNREQKRQMVHEQSLPEFLKKHIPYIRKIAPNLDQILIVSSFVSPALKLGLVDRFLVLAELFGRAFTGCLL